MSGMVLKKADALAAGCAAVLETATTDAGEKPAGACVALVELLMPRELRYETAADRYPRKRKGYRAKQTAKKKRLKTRGNGAIREYVFEREQGICRCCRIRKADSMHELLFRSLGGKVSKRNSVAVCGDGVRGCHGFLQRNEVRWDSTALGAEDLLTFRPMTQKSADWMRVELYYEVCSMPGGRNEELETC